MLYYRTIVSLMLVCVSLSFHNYVPLQRDTGYKENDNTFDDINGEETFKLTGLSKKKNKYGTDELRKSDSYVDSYGFVLRPDWKVKSTRTESYSYEGFLPNEDSNFNNFNVDVEKPNKLQRAVIDLKATRKQEKCFHTIQNEIANLFYDDFEISKNIFPLCCKKETKCKQKTTKCMTVPVPKTTKKRQEQTKKSTNTLKQLTPRIPTSVHHTVSNEAVVNVVIHVKCDHPAAREHVLPSTISLYPPFNGAETKNLSHGGFKGSEYNFSVNFSTSKTTEVTKYSIVKTKDRLTETKLNEEPCIKRYENGRPHDCLDDRLFGEQETTTEDNTKDKLKLPRPLLPHDITIQITKPSHKPQTTILPAFICQITPRFCNTIGAKSVILSKSSKPGFTLWKKIKIPHPHFWNSIPITKNNGCFNETGSKSEVPTCRNEKEEQQTSGKHVSCLPDPNTTEEPAVNKCEVSTNTNTCFETPESVTCDPGINRTEHSSLIGGEMNDSGLTLGPFQVQCDLDSVRPLSPTSLQSNIELDQTLSEPYCEDTESLQSVTEPTESSFGLEELPTDPYQPYSESEQLMREPGQPTTEHGTPSVTFDLRYVELGKTPKTSDQLGTDLGQGLAHNVLKPNSQEKTTVQDGDFSFPTSTNANDMIMPDKQNILIPGQSLTDTTSELFQGTQDLLEKIIGLSTTDDGSPSKLYDDKGTETPTANIDLLDLLKSNPLIGNPTNKFLDKSSSEQYSSTISINKLIGSEQVVNDLSTSSSNISVELLQLIKETNHETTVSNLANSSITENSVTMHSGLDSGIATEYIISPTTSETISFETQNQTQSTVSIQIGENSSTGEEHNYKTTEEDVKNIIVLNNTSLLFYRNHKWFITNTRHMWSFDEGTVEIVNDTFTKMSTEHDNNEKNKEAIKNMFTQAGAYNESEEVPFEIFAQVILLFSEVNHHIGTFEWSGMYLNLKEIIAMLRITSFDSMDVSAWGSVNWMVIFRLVKESAIATSHDTNEYNITEADGSVHSLIVYSNGSSVWKNIQLQQSEILNTIQNLNSNIYFFEHTMNEPYKSNNQSFISFLKTIVEQRINANVTYSEYTWESGTYKWDEIQALLTMINNTLTDISKLESSIYRQWDDLLVVYRSSTRHYYSDRTVYDISFDTGMKHMTVFTNGTTDYDGNRVTLDDFAKKVNGFTVSEVPFDDPQHILNLGGGKYQFYWNNKWYITDYVRTWGFEDHTSALMNESFFALPEDLTVSRDSFHKVLFESSYSDYFEIPFELFAQILLTAAKYSEDRYYQWGDYSFNYAEISAMLRMSDFDTFYDYALDNIWGQINWHAIYDKVEKSPKSTTADLQAYEMLDYDGYVYPLIIFTNGTSIRKHKKLDLMESLAMLKGLNSKAYFPDIMSVSTYASSADSFISFMSEAITDRIHRKILHSFYVWKSYRFRWEDLEAINRILLHHYESKLANDLSFSKIALPVLSSLKLVFPNRTEFQVNLGAQIKPLVVYPNGTTEYDNVKSEFMDTVRKVEELQTSSNMTFREDWGSGVITLQDVKPNETEPVDNIYSKGGFHSYDWNQLNNNPHYNVCYPINLGGGKVQFYMKNTWFITDGENIWTFEDPLPNFYINEMVKTMHQTFTDDPHLDKAAIQDLVDSKQTLKGLEELIMPHELIIHHFLFFMKHLDRQVALKISQEVVYQREKLHLSSVHLLLALRLSAYNNFSTTEVELPWEKGKKLNWDWFFFLGKRSERLEIMGEWTDALNTSHFDEFKDTPLLTVHSNLSSDWGGQRLELEEALLKTQNANKLNSFVPVVVNGEFTSKNESFEGFYKDALNKRFEQKRSYSKYKWLTDSVSWFDILIVVRYPEAKPGAVHDNMFWKTSLKGITRSWKNKFSDRVEYEVSGIDSNKDLTVTVYMNESTVLNGKKMDIEEYRGLL